MAAAHKDIFPVAVGILLCLRFARLIGNHAGHAKTCFGGGVETLPHALVGGKRLAFLDAKRSQHSQLLGVEGFSGFVLDYLVEIDEVLEIIGVDGICR